MSAYQSDDAMRQYWGVPLRPDAAMPETNIVTLFTPPKL